VGWLTDSFEQYSVAWILISAFVGGVIGSATKFLFEDVLRPRLGLRRDAKAVLARFTTPLMRSSETLERQINNFVLNGGNPSDNSQLATVGNGDFIQFDLDTTVNILGYDISQISTFGGWNDAGRDHQLFKLSYSLVGSSDFTYLGSLDSDNGASPNQSAIQADFATALTGVDSIRLDFFGGQENGYVGLGEVDAIGAPTVVPEPASAGMLLVGAIGLLHRRRSGQPRA